MISLVSDITDAKGRHARGWLFYDADCQFCTRVASRLAGPIMRRGFAVAPLQDPRVAILLGLSPEELLRSVRFVISDAGHFSGANALLGIARELWWARPLAWLSKLPGVMAALHAGYQWGTERWRCRARPGAC